MSTDTNKSRRAASRSPQQRTEIRQQLTARGKQLDTRRSLLFRTMLIAALLLFLNMLLVLNENSLLYSVYTSWTNLTN